MRLKPISLNANLRKILNFVDRDFVATLNKYSREKLMKVLYTLIFTSLLGFFNPCLAQDNEAAVIEHSDSFEDIDIPDDEENSESTEKPEQAAEQFIVKTILEQMAIISGLSDSESTEAVRQFLIKLNAIDNSEFVEKLGLTKSDFFTLGLSVAGAAWGIEKADEVEKASVTIDNLTAIAHAFSEQLIEKGEGWIQSGDGIDWLKEQAKPVFDRLKDVFSDKQTSNIRLHMEAFGNLQRNKLTGQGNVPNTLSYLDHDIIGPSPENGVYTEDEFHQKMQGVKRDILDSSFNMYLAGQAFSMAFQLGSILHTADIMRNAGLILDSTETFEEEIVSAFAQLKGYFSYIKENEFKAQIETSKKLELARHILFLERKMAQLQLVITKKIAEITGLRNNTLIPKRNASIYSCVTNLFSGAVTLYNANNMNLSNFYYSLGNLVGFLQISMGMTNAVQSRQLMQQIDTANRKLIGLKSIETMFDNISQTVLNNLDKEEQNEAS